MALVVPKVEKVVQLELILARLNTCTIHLFKNDVTPDADDDESLFTEADFDGYASQDLDDWGAAAVVGDNARTVHPVSIWLHGGGAGSNTIYGYYVLDGDGDLVLSERRAAGGFVVDAGKGFVVQAVYDLRPVA